MAIQEWLSNAQRSKQIWGRRGKSKRRRQAQSHVTALEKLETRQLLTADLAWDGDVLQISGSEDNDFIAVQQDSTGLRVFTEDTMLAEYQGRSFETAVSIDVAGMGGNDVLISHHTTATIPVHLAGNGGHDFLYSNSDLDSLDGGADFDWVQSLVPSAGPVENLFGIDGLNPAALNLLTTPQFDGDGRINLQIETDGEVQIADRTVAVSGLANMSSAGFDVALTGEISTWNNAFGIQDVDLSDTAVTVTAGTEIHNGDGYRVDVNSSLHVSGTEIDVAGSVDITNDSTSGEFTGTVANWNNAFGIESLLLTDAELTASGSVDIHGNQSLTVGVEADMVLEGTSIEVAGDVDLQPNRTDAHLHGSIENWNDAFGVSGLDLNESTFDVVAFTDHDRDFGLQIDLTGKMQVEEIVVDVSGEIAIAPTEIDAAFYGSVAHWDDAFGIAGLDLKNSELNINAYSDRQADYDLYIDVLAEMEVEETDIEVTGSINITPEHIDAVLAGSVDHWDNAFGIDRLDLQNSDVNVVAYSDRRNEFDLRVDLDADLNLEGTLARVEGVVEISPDRIAGSLVGRVAADWDNAFGIDGLDLADTRLELAAARDATGSEFSVDIEADLDVLGTSVDITGQLELNDKEISGSLVGVVAGTWTSAFGIAPLHLNDTTLSVSGKKTSAGSEISLGVSAGLSLPGTEVGIRGTVEMTGDDVRTSLTGSVTGEWLDAFGVPGLQLRDTDLTLSGNSDSSGFDVDLNSDLYLFGGYIDIIGDLDFSADGVSATFRPPESIGFTDLLGIPGFTLDDADLAVSLATDGLEVVVDSTMNLGNIDVDFTGQFAVRPDEVEASLTGRVAEWDNAFEVPGLNLNDVVLTLGAESGVGGASMFIGLGAGLEVGSSELTVAGMVGIGTTGWEVAFRGETDSLEGDDLIDFANTMNRAADPDANEIADGSLGDLELRTAFINFAPLGGNEALGIEDGFGIGGAFYRDGELLGSGAFVVDIGSGVFHAMLDIPEMELGPVELSDVVIDVRMAPMDSHFKVSGAAELLGARVELDGTITSNSFSLEGRAGVDMAGLSASVTFYVDQTGVSFEAIAGGGAIDAIKQNATREIRAVAEVAQKAIDVAQGAVDKVQNEVDDLTAELADARADAQKEIDRVKANIAKAKSVVDRAARSKTYWYNQRRARYSRWRSAVSATRRARWYQKARYKAIEVSRYASYAYAAGRYASQIVVHRSADAAYKAVRNAAGWVLDNAGVEANPNVLRIKALLLVANTGVDAAEVVLNGVEKANQSVLNALDVVDSFQVKQIKISGDLANYVNAGVSVSIDTVFAGRKRSFSMSASTEGLVDQVGKEMLAAIF